MTRSIRLNTIANGMRQITGGARRDDIWKGEGAISIERITDVLKARGRGWWNCIFNLFDHSPGALDPRIDRIRSHFAAHLPQARLTVTRWKRGEPQQPWMRQDVSLAPFSIVDWRGTPGGHSDFGPVVAAVGERVDALYRMVERRFIEYGMDPWVGMFGIGGRALAFVADMLFVQNDKAMTDRCKALYRQLCQDAAEMGFGVYRTHIEFMADAATPQTWNDNALPRLNARLKHALDPNGILAPGKQGIGTKP